MMERAVARGLRLAFATSRPAFQSTNLSPVASPQLYVRSFRRGSLVTGKAGEDSVPSVDVEELAQKARLRLAPEEVEEFRESITGILNWFSQLEAIDVSGVNPEIRPGDEQAADSTSSALREDIPQEFENRKEMLDQVPQFDGTYIRVPRILND